MKGSYDAGQGKLIDRGQGTVTLIKQSRCMPDWIFGMDRIQV